MNRTKSENTATQTDSLIWCLRAEKKHFHMNVFSAVGYERIFATVLHKNRFHYLIPSYEAPTSKSDDLNTGNLYS